MRHTRGYTVSGPRCEPKYNCVEHYITLCYEGPISRYCTVLARHLVPVPRSSCFLYLFVSHSRNSLLENVNMEMTYQAFHFIFVSSSYFSPSSACIFFTRPFSLLLSLSYTVFARVICALFFLFWPLKNRGA